MLITYTSTKANLLYMSCFKTARILLRLYCVGLNREWHMTGGISEAQILESLKLI